jgi:hypothetical protein
MEVRATRSVDQGRRLGRLGTAAIAFGLATGRKVRPVRKWLRSDLIGIPATLLAFGVFALTVGAFYVAGPLAGLAFSMPVWVVIFAFRRQPSDVAGISKGPDGHRHQVLVIADHGLEHAALIDEVTRRGELAETEVMSGAPVVASSRSHA